MKIVHISPEYYPAVSGVGQVVKELAERQAREGNEVYVFTSDWDKNKRVNVKQEIINGVIIKRYKHFLRVGNFESFWPQFIFSIINGSFDIIHSHVFGHLHFALAALGAKISGSKHIHTTHCPWSDAYRSTIARIGLLISYNIVSGFFLRLTDKIILITPWENELIKKYGAEEKQLINLPNGMSNDFFKKIKNNDFKRKFRIKSRIVLFLGRLNPTKGPDKFVEIAKLILKEKKDVTFVIIGPDEGMKTKVKKMIGKEKNILLLEQLKNREEVIKAYQSSDIFVLPSYREGLPLTLFEAMASGLPIVASPVNGIPYEMKEPENGFLVNYGDNQKFANKIIELLENKKLREKISKNNIKKAKKYDWDLIAKKTLQIYKSK